jgi:hypothetical protein
MAALETIETLSGALMSDERILSVAERELLANLLQRANQSAEVGNRIVPDEITRIVGEIVAERASGILGSGIALWMQKELGVPANRPATAPMRLGAPPPKLPPAPSPDAPRPTGPTPPGGGIRDLRAREHQASSPNVAIADRPALGGPPPKLPPAPSPDAPRPTGPTPPGGDIRPLQASWGTRELADQSSVLPAQCVLLEEFLAPEELQAIMQDTLAREMEFQISEVIAPGVAGGVTDFEHRRSRVLMDLGTRHDNLLRRLQACLPRVVRKLGHDPLRPSRVEMQITASNDGDFFHWHCDNAEQTIASREITFVYFFHREPKKFRGGELRIYDSRWENGAYTRTQNYRAIVPQQNQVVLFASSLAHEITVVECPSREFGDSRFTVNGWFHR